MYWSTSGLPDCDHQFIGFGRTLGMSVVIKGIETDAQNKQLLGWGCTQGRGILVCVADELLHWLQLRRDARARY